MPADLFDSIDEAEWYDRSINWSARLERELPALIDVFGPPGNGGLVDAGCGTGRQALALAARGYRVVGADLSDEMLQIARRAAAEVAESDTCEDHRGPDGQARPAPAVRFVAAGFADLHDQLGDGYDGVLCLGNALAAAGSQDAVSAAVRQFGACLRSGGRLFVQVLNFPPMREEHPCVRGPRAVYVDGVEYVSLRTFHFTGDSVEVTNVTLWKDGGWKTHARCGALYPVTPDELAEFCRGAGLLVDQCWGSYAREPFDPRASSDLILVATRST